MGLFTGTGLDPDKDPTTDVWPTTLLEIRARGLEIHGSLSKRNLKEGATATVLKATETPSGRIVAVKVYKDPLKLVSHRNGATIPMLNFFENERRMLAALDSCPFVPRYYYSVTPKDCSQPADTPDDQLVQPFHVMEFVDGEHITKYVRESFTGRGRILATVKLFRSFMEAVAAIHQVGYLHRDLSDGNVLIDRSGRVRLVDLAEAAPLADKHTRLLTTPGFGTEGIASSDEIVIRKIQADDVRDACTIGYAMFTGTWKQPAEDVVHWQHALRTAGTPPSISKILLKGMNPRDRSQELDRRVWNSAAEVKDALDRWLHRRVTARRAFRRLGWLVATTCLLFLLYRVANERLQQQNYIAQLTRLKNERVQLSDHSGSALADLRVQKQVSRADTLEREADRLCRQGMVSQAARKLSDAVIHMHNATRMAEDITRLRPMMEPIKKILLENTQWNQGSPAITQQLAELGKDYQEIRNQVETGSPHAAWTSIAALQPKLVSLIDSNQQSYEIASLLIRIEAETTGLDPELEKLTAYPQIMSSRKRALEFYRTGAWTEAKTEVLSCLQSVRDFLDMNETAQQRNKRLMASSHLAKCEIGACESLRDQVVNLTKRLAESQDREDQKLEQELVLRKQRDQALLQLQAFRSELQSSGATLTDHLKTMNSKLTVLAQSDADRDRLAEIATALEELIAQYSSRLPGLLTSSSNTPSDEHDAEIAFYRALDRSSAGDIDSSSKKTETRHNPETAAANLLLSQDDTNAQSVASRNFVTQVNAWHKLLQQQKLETSREKRVADDSVQSLDARLSSQIRQTLLALKELDKFLDNEWRDLESEIDVRVAERDAKTAEGGSFATEEQGALNSLISTLRAHQQHYIEARNRLKQNIYTVDNWPLLSRLPEIQFATELVQEANQIPLQKTFRQTCGQRFVYLSPGRINDPAKLSRSESKRSVQAVSASKSSSTHGFFISEHEVTQAIYERITGEAPWRGLDYVLEGDDYPAVYVSWQDLTEKFIPKLNQIDRMNAALPSGWEYRLPTEAEWEYAARAGCPDRFCFGNDVSQLGDYAWFDANAWNAQQRHAQRVGTRRPSLWGLFDMHGNCWEWTSDVYAQHAKIGYGNEGRENHDVLRAYRGGSFYFPADACELDFRDGCGPEIRRSDLGFRLVLVRETDS